MDYKQFFVIKAINKRPTLFKLPTPVVYLLLFALTIFFTTGIGQVIHPNNFLTVQYYCADTFNSLGGFNSTKWNNGEYTPDQYRAVMECYKKTQEYTAEHR